MNTGTGVDARPMSLDDKVQAAITLIKREWKPGISIVMSSFGKDSMVMLDLFKRARIKPPVLFFQDPHFPRKNAFAHCVIAVDDYVTYSYMPFEVQPCKRRGEFEIVNFYNFGDGYLAVPLGITRPVPGQPFLCGLNDLIRRPLGTAVVPWRTLFVGHKTSDVDPVHGPVPIQDDTVTAKGVTAVFPLRLFTDADVWAYHALRDLPYHEARYKPNGQGEWEDKTFNPDRIPTCCACFDPDGAEDSAAAPVFCPKQNVLVPYVTLTHSDGRMPLYVKQQADPQKQDDPQD